VRRVNPYLTKPTAIRTYAHGEIADEPPALISRNSCKISHAVCVTSDSPLLICATVLQTGLLLSFENDTVTFGADMVSAVHGLRWCLGVTSRKVYTKGCISSKVYSQCRQSRNNSGDPDNPLGCMLSERWYCDKRFGDRLALAQHLERMDG